MDQPTDIEKTASGAAVRSVSPDSVVPQPSPPLAGTTQVERQPPKPLSSPETVHEPPDLIKKFQDFKALVDAKMQHQTQREDAVQAILLINLLEARTKLMQHEIHFRCRESSEDYRVPVDHAAIEADVNRHSRAVQAIETYRKFYRSFPFVLGRFDREILGRLAAERATVAEYEQQDIADGDTAQQLFILDMRSRLVNEEQRMLYPRVRRLGNLFNMLEEYSAFESRLKMAIFGALILLIPMLIMVLHATKLTALLTTILCVLSVAVALSFGMHDAEGKDVLGATAAYAAVLVVFVGTSTTTSELSNGIIGAIAGGVCGGCLLIFAMWYFFRDWMDVVARRLRSIVREWSAGRGSEPQTLSTLG